MNFFTYALKIVYLSKQKTTVMKRSPLLLLVLFSSLLFLSSCGDLKQTRDLYDDWWPVRASGSYENEKFSAQWNGALGVHGDIVIKYVNKSNPSLFYEETKYYPAYKFSKQKKTFSTISIESLGDTHTLLRGLKFEVKKGMIYFEKANDRGKGTGEFDEGHTLQFLDDNTVQIGDVQYQRYQYFKEQHPETFRPLSEMGFDLDEIPITRRD